MTSKYFQNGSFKWGINVDDMWVYAGLPPPVNISRNQVVGKKIEGGLRGVSHRDVQLWKHSPPPNYEEEVPHLKRLAEEAVSDLAMEMSTSGIDFVRCWFQWNFFQPKMDTHSYRFPLDNFVSALRAKGIEIIAVLACGYSRFLPIGINEDSPVTYLSTLEKTSREIVNHYSKSIRIWQIENEPNWWFAHSASGWRRGSIWQLPGFEEDALRLLGQIVREESPSSLVAINLEADRKRTTWKSYSKFCDVIGLDFYPNYMKSMPIDVSAYDFSAEIRKSAGLPCFIAETGYPSGPSYEGFSEYNQELFVEAATEKAYSIDALNGISIWRYSDSDWQSFPKQENYFGLKREDRTPKSGWTKYLQLIKKFKSQSTTIHRERKSEEKPISP